MAEGRFGLQKTSLLDFPEEVAAVIFLPGCNLRCPYCHNPELVRPPFPDDLLDFNQIRAFLEKRKNVLGGVCFTGGEPLLSPFLPQLFNLIKSLKLKIKLDTNGIAYDKLIQFKPDYIAMDIKTAPEKYRQLTPAGEDVSQSIKKSARWIIKSKIKHEFRTTVCQGLPGREDCASMAETIQGADIHYLTPFKPGKTLDPKWSEKEKTTLSDLKDIQKCFTQLGINTKLRSGD